jgi:peroxiredoxin Q/BCP
MGMKLAKRNTFLINPEGKIAKEWIGVDPSHHSEEVLTAIKELQKSNGAQAELRDDTRP